MITYWIDSQTDEEDDDPPRYSNIILEEEYEDDDHPEGFEGLEKGSVIDQPQEQITIKPWDPSENFFIIV